MSRYMLDEEKYLLEDLLNRVIDADESDASAGLSLVKKQAERILAYREEEERKAEQWRLESERKKAQEASKVPPSPEVEKRLHVASATIEDFQSKAKAL